MAYKLNRRKLVLCKTETEYGVDPTPTESANAVLVEMSPSIKLEGEKVERAPVRDHLSPLGHVIASKAFSFDMTVEGKGGGMDSTTLRAPEYESLLLACGLQRTDLIELAVDDVTGFTVGQTVSGDISSAVGTVYRIKADTNRLVLKSVTGTFEPEGEDVTGSGGTSPTATAYCWLEVADGTQFEVGDAIEGGTSGATGTIVAIQGNNLIVGSVAVSSFVSGETVSAGSDSSTSTREGLGGLPEIEYRPVSDPASQKSATIYHYEDAILHKMFGCRSSFEWTSKVNEIPKFKFTIQGLYGDHPTDVTMLTGNTLDLVPPLAAGIGLKVGAYTPVLQSFNLNGNNTLAKRLDVNNPNGVTGIILKERRPTGSIDPEVDVLSTFDPFDLWRNATPAEIAATYGKTAGNRITIEVEQALYEEVSYGERDGITTYDLPFVCQGVAAAGDDEYRLIYS